MRMFFASLIVLGSSVLANADETPITGPNGLSIVCSDFEPLGGGRWHSKASASLTYPTRPGSFGDNTLGPHGINIGGTDIAVFLSEHCH